MMTLVLSTCAENFKKLREKKKLMIQKDKQIAFSTKNQNIEFKYFKVFY